MEPEYSSISFFVWLFLGLALLIPISFWFRDFKRRLANEKQIRQRERERKKAEKAREAAMATKSRYS